MDSETEAILRRENGDDVVDILGRNYRIMRGDNESVYADYVRQAIDLKSHFQILFGTSNSGKSFATRGIVRELAKKGGIRMFVLKPTWEGEDELYHKLSSSMGLIRGTFNQKAAMIVTALIQQAETMIRAAVQAGKKKIPEPRETWVILDDIQALSSEEEKESFRQLTRTLARTARHSNFRTLLLVQSLVEIPKQVRSNVTSLILTTPVDDENAETIRKVYHRLFSAEQFANLKLPAYSLLVKHKLGQKRVLYIVSDEYL